MFKLAHNPKWFDVHTPVNGTKVIFSELILLRPKIKRYGLLTVMFMNNQFASTLCFCS